MDKSNYFQQGIMKEVKSNLGKWEIFHWILSRQRMTPKKDIKKEKIQDIYIHMHMVHLCAAQKMFCVVLKGT